MGLLRIRAAAVDVFNGWLTLGSDEERTHVRISDITGWQYAVADGALTVVTTEVTLVVLGTADDYEVTNQLDRILWTSLVEGDQ